MDEEKKEEQEETKEKSGEDVTKSEEQTEDDKSYVSLLEEIRELRTDIQGLVVLLAKENKTAEEEQDQEQAVEKLDDDENLNPEEVEKLLDL